MEFLTYFGWFLIINIILDVFAGNNLRDMVNYLLKVSMMYVLFCIGYCVFLGFLYYSERMVKYLGIT